MGSLSFGRELGAFGGEADGGVGVEKDPARRPEYGYEGRSADGLRQLIPACRFLTGLLAVDGEPHRRPWPSPHSAALHPGLSSSFLFCSFSFLFFSRLPCPLAAPLDSLDLSLSLFDSELLHCRTWLSSLCEEEGEGVSKRAAGFALRRWWA